MISLKRIHVSKVFKFKIKMISIIKVYCDKLHYD